MKYPLLKIAFTLLLLFAGCSKDAPTAAAPFDPPPSIHGRWQGQTNSGYQLIMDFSDMDDGAITGTGWIGPLPVLIDGKKNYPKIAFTLTTPGYQQAAFSGSLVTADSMTGQFNYSGFSNDKTFISKTH
ncbi:MAG: hypothetical protein ACOYNS_09470 [Bacteroidota bacterium]